MPTSCHGSRISEPRSSAAQTEWRAWLEANHAKADELLVGFHKVGSGRGGLTYKQAVDEALASAGSTRCAAAGTRHWTIRFTPRKARSIWSQVNIKRLGELTALGACTPPASKPSRHATRSCRTATRSRTRARRSRRTTRALPGQQEGVGMVPGEPPLLPAARHLVGGQRQAGGDARRRLATLIADLAAGRKIKPLTRPGKAMTSPCGCSSSGSATAPAPCAGDEGDADWTGGTVRAVDERAALAAEGSSVLFDGRTGRGVAEAVRRRRIWSCRSRRRRRSGARPPSREHPRRPASAMDRLPVDRRRLWRLWRRLGGRGDAAASRFAAVGWRGSRPSGRGRPPRTRASRWRFSASREFTVPAATPSSTSPTAPRTASSSRARCSTASTSTTLLPHLAAARTRAAGVFNLADDEPAPPQDVVAFAAGLMGSPRRRRSFDKAELSPMARSFYGENKRVAERAAQADLGVALRYPTYREGLSAMWREGTWRA